MNYDDWKLATPLYKSNPDFYQEKCKACGEWFHIDSLDKLNHVWYTLNERSLVCTECKEIIEQELNSNLTL